MIKLEGGNDCDSVRGLSITTQRLSLCEHYTRMRARMMKLGESDE